MVTADERLLSQAEAAEFLGVSPHTLNRWRVVRQGPEYIKFGQRLVRYRFADLAAWVESQRKRTSTNVGAARKAGGR